MEPQPKIPTIKRQQQSIGQNKMDALVILDDFVLEDLHEVLVRNGLYLPQKCHW